MTNKSPDPSEAGINWASQEVAERRSRGQARRAQLMGPATELMLDLADVRAGSRVLDVAAGTGDQTLFAARRVGPNGYVLATDISASMLDIASETAEKAGLTNVGTRVMDAESLDFDAGSFDAVICQLGLMLFPNPARELRAMHRVVRPDGKVAALVFSTAEKNPYQGIVLNVARRFGGTPLPLFVLGEGNVLENTFKDCGFHNVAVRAVNHRRQFSSIAEIFHSLKESAFLRQPIEKLGETERDQAWLEIERQLRQFEAPNGVEMPGEFLIGVGTK